MGKTIKIWLIAGPVLILAGILLFGGVMTVLKWDFSKLSTVKYQTVTHKVDEPYTNISVITDTADIVFVPSPDGATTITCHEQANVTHSVGVQDGTLVISVVDTRKWHEYIGINFGKASITVSLPQGDYGALTLASDTGDTSIPAGFCFESISVSESTGDVALRASASGAIRINTSTGDILVKDISAESLNLSVSTGRVTVSQVTCQEDATIRVSTGKVQLTELICGNFTSSGDTGTITLENVLVSGKITIERDTGDVKFDRCDAAELFIQTDTGSVSGTLLTSKVFLVSTDTGSISVPKTTTGGKCEITTDTGNIKISVAS